MIVGQQPQSPKTKQKTMSPRGPGSGLIGRPPGPAKTALTTLRGAPGASASPPRLPGSPVQSTGSPLSLGPPVLHSSQTAVLPGTVGAVASPTPPTLDTAPSAGVVYGQPPKLQPMLPTTASSGGGTSSPAPVPTLNKNSLAVSKTEKNSNGLPSVSASSVKDKERKPDNTLTHYIDGYVIQESGEPFPIDREDKGE